MSGWNLAIRTCVGVALVGIATAGGADAPASKAGVSNSGGGQVGAPDAAAQGDERVLRIAAFTADALQSLNRSAAFLGKQERFSFGVDLSNDVLQPTGQMLEFGGRREVLVRRPDRLWIESESRAGELKLLYFDGRSILIDMPQEDAYVEVEKPGTLYAALAYLVDELDTETPLDDFVSEDFTSAIEGRIASGFYAGTEQLDGRACEHLAFRADTVDFQIWIAAGEAPLPCRLVITYKDAPGQPEFRAEFRDWNLSPDTDDALFTFTPPEGADRLQVQAVARSRRERREGR